MQRDLLFNTQFKALVCHGFGEAISASCPYSLVGRPARCRNILVRTAACRKRRWSRRSGLEALNWCKGPLRIAGSCSCSSEAIVVPIRQGYLKRTALHLVKHNRKLEFADVAASLSNSLSGMMFL